MKQRDELQLFYNKVMDQLKNDHELDNFSKYFYNSFLAGDTTLYQKNIAEFKNFDNEWIDTLDSYIPSIEKIIRNPKSTLRFDEEVIPIEKAKKISSASIRHLAVNTQLIKEIDEDGNIIPKKILTHTPEIDYGIYENRFIMTLINRLAIFVGNRYEVIKANINSYQRNHINMTSNFGINNTEVNMTIDMDVKSNIEDSSLKERNEKLMARVTRMVSVISSFKASKFMEELKDQKPVIPPIMKTNIILKNPDFRNAYNLWLFLDHYNALIYDIDVQEKDMDLDRDYIENLNQIALVNYAVIIYNQEYRKDIYDTADMVQYERKATKIIRTNPRDMVENPDGILMEDNTVNEYYLDQNQRIYKKSLADMLGSDITFEEALKKAMTQTMDITNSLYKSVFDIDPNVKKDVIKELAGNSDLQAQLEDAKRKANIAKVIRETKERDLKETIQLEREQLKNVKKINSDLIKQKSAQRKLARAKKGLTSGELQAEQEINEVTDKSKLIENSIAELAQIRKNLEEEQKKVTQQLIEQTDKEIIAAEKAKARLERQEEMKRLREERRKAILEQRQYYKEQKEMIREKYRQLKEKLIIGEQQRREEQLADLKKQFEEIRERELERVRAGMGG